MRLIIPITGTVLVEGSLADGSLTGDNNDPIRPVSLDLGNVSWKMVDVDLKNEVMIIEVEPGGIVSEPTGELGAGNKPVYRTRPATAEEKLGFLQHARHLIESHTKDELYQMSGCSRLKRPLKREK